MPQLTIVASAEKFAGDKRIQAVYNNTNSGSPL